MTIQGLSYWYDGQQRRFLEQVVRAFSGFSYMTGRKNGEEPQLRMVPCRMASRDRMVAQIMRNGTENAAITCPLITVDQTGLSPRRNDLQNPLHIDTLLVNEREVDRVTGEYTGNSGNRYTVRRMMPVPFEMSIQVDVWTSNLDQKHQLGEQMLMVFFPDIQIQNSENALDWSARTLMMFDDLTWSSRSIPVGTESEIDILTMTFKLPFWLSPPAEVTQQRIIEQVITNIQQPTTPDQIKNIQQENLNFADGDQATPFSRQIVSPGDHRIEVDGRNGTIKLLGAKGAELDENGHVYRWDDLIHQYGTLRLMTSKIHLKRNDNIDDENEIVGLIQPDQNHANMLFWQIDPDTLSANTLPPIKALIDPLKTHPLNGLTPLNGDRYLLLEDIGPSEAWGSLTARANDIIRYSDGSWVIDFHAVGTTQEQFLINLFSGTQLRWTGTQWQLAIGGIYGPGYWRLYL